MQIWDIMGLAVNAGISISNEARAENSSFWIIGVRDHFRLGGHNMFCPNFVSLPAAVAWRRRILYSFLVIVFRKLRRGRVWVSPSHGETFLDLGVSKLGFWWVIRLKITSTLAPNVHNDCSIRGTVFRKCCIGLQGGGIPLQRWGLFCIFWN